MSPHAGDSAAGGSRGLTAPDSESWDVHGQADLTGRSRVHRPDTQRQLEDQNTVACPPKSLLAANDDGCLNSPWADPWALGPPRRQRAPWPKSVEVWGAPARSRLLLCLLPLLGPGMCPSR